MPLKPNLTCTVLKAIVSFCLILLASCATPQVELRHPLSQQILKPRPGYKGLTNRACEALNEKGECAGMVVKEYLLEDPVFRKTANDLKFICSVGGRRFKICLDQPGLCRTTYEDCGWFCKDKKKVEYIPANQYQFLLDANTVCQNREIYD
jgi:hypothetical protein